MIKKKKKSKIFESVVPVVNFTRMDTSFQAEWRVLFEGKSERETEKLRVLPQSDFMDGKKVGKILFFYGFIRSNRRLWERMRLSTSFSLRFRVSNLKLRCFFCPLSSWTLVSVCETRLALATLMRISHRKIWADFPVSLRAKSFSS